MISLSMATTTSVPEARFQREMDTPGAADRDVGMREKELARLEGFEPPTNGFGSHYSIRLSYGRTGRAF